MFRLGSVPTYLYCCLLCVPVRASTLFFGSTLRCVAKQASAHDAPWNVVSWAEKGCSQRATKTRRGHNRPFLAPCCGCIPPAPSILYRRKNRLSSFSILEHRPLVSFSSPVTLTPKKLHRWIDAPNVNAKAGCSLCRRGQRPESGHNLILSLLSRPLTFVVCGCGFQLVR